MKNHRIIVWIIGMLTVANMSAQYQFEVNTKKLGAEIQPTMWGIFFEDINFGADGGLYAEMVENRSFEFPQPFMGWDVFGHVELHDSDPAFPRNPHYVTLQYAGHKEKRTGLDNHGFFGMGLKEGMDYHFSVWARTSVPTAGDVQLRIELVGNDHSVIDNKKLTISNTEWQRYEVTLTAKKTDEKAFLRIFHNKGGAVDLDHISLFPADNWHGLRADLVQDLKDLHPGVFRFPGGCIVEGTQLSSRYQWKNSVGPAENRPLNENRWNYTFAHRMFPNYFQTYGLGFYELFLLSMLMFYPPDSDEIRAYAKCCGFDAENAYDAVLDELKKAIREKSLCTNYSFDRGDNVYYYIDIKKLLQILGSEEGRKLTLADRDQKVREAFEEIVKLVSEKDKEARENIRSFDSILSGFFPDAPSSGE